MAFPTGWICKSALVVQHGQVTADQTAFPVLITEASFATNCSEILTTGDPNAAQSDGGDLRFSTDSAGASQIACEVVLWSQNATFASARAEIYVPRNILTASDVTIYVWWSAGGGLSQPAANASFGSQAVWDANYLAVYHLNEATNATATDSTSHANNSVNNVSTQIVGKIGNGQSFNGTTEWIELPFALGNATFTVSSWIKVATAVVVGMALEGRNGSGDGDALYVLDKANLFAAPAATITSTVSVGNAAWHYIVGAYTPSTGLIYVDNNSAVSGGWTSHGWNVNGGGGQNRIARDFAGAFYAQSSDELRFSTSQRSAAWISTEYNNQNSPGTFIIAGSRIGGSSSQPTIFVLT